MQKVFIIFILAVNSPLTITITTVTVTLPPNDTPIPVVLLANKCDLPDAADFLQNRDQMDRYCADNGFIGWCETSAKDNVNIDKAAKLLVQAILESTVGKADSTAAEKQGLSLDKPASSDSKSGGCAC
jgi:Ras-related protein Rab-32